MSDAYFDADREAGEYPRKGYGWCSPEAQRREIQGYIRAGKFDPWIIREAKKFGIEVPFKYR